MLQLAIPIPSLPGRQDIEIQMLINGKKQKMQFRIELYRWADCISSEKDRIDCIRQLLDEYGDEWMIYNIEIPTDEYVPLTFVKRKDWERQRMLMREAVMA